MCVCVSVCVSVSVCVCVLLFAFIAVTKCAFVFTGIANDKLKLYGVQFHPEVDLTDNGRHMMKTFLHDICRLKGGYTMKSREAACIQYIRETVGNHKVLVCM